MCSLSFVCFVYFYVHWHASTYSPQRGEFPLRAGIFFPNKLARPVGHGSSPIFAAQIRRRPLARSYIGAILAASLDLRLLLQ
jgi:hypothetical protein